MSDLLNVKNFSNKIFKMLIILLALNIFLITGFTNAKPLEFGQTVLLSTQDLDGEESHPYQVVIKSPQTSAMEVSDDDEYEETVPVKVIAVRPKLIDGENNDLRSSATDLQAAATGYGHGGHDNSGWLDMGAYSGGYGAFGWLN
jgi:hypothetical protein